MAIWKQSNLLNVKNVGKYFLGLRSAKAYRKCAQSVIMLLTFDILYTCRLAFYNMLVFLTILLFNKYQLLLYNKYFKHFIVNLTCCQTHMLPASHVVKLYSILADTTQPKLDPVVFPSDPTWLGGSLCLDQNFLWQ